jgi:hypothetical protein
MQKRGRGEKRKIGFQLIFENLLGAMPVDKVWTSSVSIDCIIYEQIWLTLKGLIKCTEAVFLVVRDPPMNEL